MFRAINAIEEGLDNAPPESLGFRPSSDSANIHEQKQNEIDGGIVQLESLLNATVDKDFDKFEIYTLRNILAVGHDEENLAPWVRLEHYQGLDLDAAGGDSGLSVEEVQMRRRKLQETAKLNAMLKAEEARNAAVLAQLQSLVSGDAGQEGQDSPFAFLLNSQHTSTSSSTQPLYQNTQYALSQLPALRQLLQQLKDSLQTLPNARHAREDPDSTDAKRRRYIESQSRQALGRRGVEAENGEALAASSGRKIARDEVEGMEAVVQALGGVQQDRMEE